MSHICVALLGDVKICFVSPQIALAVMCARKSFTNSFVMSSSGYYGAQGTRFPFRSICLIPTSKCLPSHGVPFEHKVGGHIIRTGRSCDKMHLELGIGSTRVAKSLTPWVDSLRAKQNVETCHIGPGFLMLGYRCYATPNTARPLAYCTRLLLPARLRYPRSTTAVGGLSKLNLKIQV